MEENEKLVNSFPEVYSRRPYDENNPNGYLESDDEYIGNNHDAVIWFLENAEAIQKALTLLVNPLVPHSLKYKQQRTHKIRPACDRSIIGYGSDR